MEKCSECELARRAATDKPGFVACGYWSNQADQSPISYSGLHRAYKGWAYLQRRPEQSEGNGTVTSGLMTADCIIVQADDSCIKYQKRKDHIVIEIEPDWEAHMEEVLRRGAATEALELTREELNSLISKIQTFFQKHPVLADNWDLNFFRQVNTLVVLKNKMPTPRQQYYLVKLWFNFTNRARENKIAI